MLCEEFEDRLNAVLDDRRRPECDAELHLHCEACTDCRQRAAEYGMLLDGFYALATPLAPTDMALRVMADLQPRPLSAWRISAAAAALCTAATLLIAFVPALRGTFLPARPAPPQVAVQHPIWRNMPPERVPILRQWLRLTQSDDGDRAAALSRRAGNRIASVVLQVPSVRGPGGMPDAFDSDGLFEGPVWATQMRQDLKPVTESVTATLSLLFRSLPGVEHTKRS